MNNPELGANFSLAETQKLSALHASWRTEVYGPYEISADLYYRSVKQYHNLRDASQTGRILYMALDGNTRMGVWNGTWGAAINCIHALTDITGFARTWSMRGFEASENVAKIYQPWIIDQRPQTWLLKRIGAVTTP